MLLSLSALLISAGFLLAGGGLQGTLVAVRANLEGFSLPLIGLLTSSYYVGFILGSLKAPSAVKRAGHIRAFAAFSALTAACALAYALVVEPVLWLLLRAVTGFCFAGLYLIIESWMNEKSTNENRGQLLSTYRIVDLVAMTGGQFLLTAADPGGFVLFSLTAILVCISIVPVAMTKAIAPEPLTRTNLDIPKLWRVSPLAVAGATVVGLANGSFYAIGPVYVQQLGYGFTMIATFMSAAIIGGALSQWPIGRISDLVDRRRVLLATAVASVGAGIFLSRTGDISQTMLLTGAAFYGVFAMPLFGLSAAHGNDHADTDEFVAVSAGLLLVYGVGSVFGPALAAFLMGAFGPSALFSYTAAMHTALVVFALLRIAVSAPVPAEDQEDYVAIPRTSPGVFEIDPRSDDNVE